MYIFVCESNIIAKNLRVNCKQKRTPMHSRNTYADNSYTPSDRLRLRLRLDVMVDSRTAVDPRIIPQLR